jgi:hypothetical protein
MNSCDFKRFYKEPTEKYVCLATSLFYKDEYIKVNKDLKTYNATKIKVDLFIKNLSKTIKSLEDGTYPSNFYLRIYFDKSLFKLTEYKEMLMKLKDNPKIQLIQYTCKDYMYLNKDTHMDLFGTLIRLHAIFDDSSPNMTICMTIDSDSYLSKRFINLFNSFEKSKYLVQTISKISTVSFHRDDFMYSNTYFDFIYLIAGFILVKKTPLFNMKIWHKYFDNMYDQNELMYIFNYNDFKRLSFNSVLDKKEIKTFSYYGFNYGADEIWINYVIKKILTETNNKDLLGVFMCKDYNLKFVITRLIDVLKYNSIVNEIQFKLFLSKCDFIKDKTLDNLIKYLNNISKNDNVSNYIKIFNELKKNKFYNRIYINNSIKYIINNFEFLLKKREKFTFYEIMTS